MNVARNTARFAVYNATMKRPVKLQTKAKAFPPFVTGCQTAHSTARSAALMIMFLSERPCSSIKGNAKAANKLMHTTEAQRLELKGPSQFHIKALNVGGATRASSDSGWVEYGEVKKDRFRRGTVIYAPAQKTVGLEILGSGWPYVRS